MIYVDPLKPIGSRQTCEFCHLWADTREQLVEFAASIGLSPRAWEHSEFPAYDLTATKRKIAVDAGSVEVPATARAGSAGS